MHEPVVDSVMSISEIGKIFSSRALFSRTYENLIISGHGSIVVSGRSFRIDRLNEDRPPEIPGGPGIVAESRRDPFPVLIRIHQGCRRHGFQLRQTIDPPRGFPGPVQGRQQHRRQDRDDRYHHEQFDQREMDRFTLQV